MTQKRKERLAGSTPTTPQPVVTRTFYVYEKRRTITIAYKYTRATKVLEYGATIFRSEKTNDVFERKTHRATALSRLNKHPVVVQMEDNDTLEVFHHNIRDVIHAKGVKSKTQVMPTATTVSNIAGES